MDQRKRSRMVRRTNVDDLLDDGIENDSDLKSFARTADDAADATPEESQVDLPTQSPRPRKQTLPETLDAVPHKGPISYLGLLFGACFVVAGLVLFVYPREAYVFHDRLRYSPIVEHVTATGSQIYAVLAVVVGIAICGFSLYRPKE
jgi:hypothetical protein